MDRGGRRNKLAHNVDMIGHVRTSDNKIDKTTNKMMVSRRIRKRITICRGYNPRYTKVPLSVCLIYVVYVELCVQDIKKRVNSKVGPAYKVAGPTYSRQGRINLFLGRCKKAQAGIWLGNAGIGLNPAGPGILSPAWATVLIPRLGRRPRPPPGPPSSSPAWAAALARLGRSSVPRLGRDLVPWLGRLLPPSRRGPVPRFPGWAGRPQDPGWAASLRARSAPGPPLIPARLPLPPGWPRPAPPAGRPLFRPGRDWPRPEGLPRKYLSQAGTSWARPGFPYPGWVGLYTVFRPSWAGTATPLAGLALFWPGFTLFGSFLSSGIPSSTLCQSWDASRLRLAHPPSSYAGLGTPLGSDQHTPPLLVSLILRRRIRLMTWRS
jgi:hypothetical protein